MRLFFYGTWTYTWNLGIARIITRLSGGEKEVIHCSNLDTTPQENDVVIPLMEEHALALYENKGWISKAMIPSRETLWMLMDKVHFYQHIQTQGLVEDVPPTCIDEASRPAFVEKHGPFFLRKPRKACGGQGILMVEPHIPLPPDFLLQAYIPGSVEYTAHIVARHGHLLCCIVYEYQHPPVATVIKTSALPMKRVEEKDRMAMVMEVLERVVSSCDYHGIGNIDFKIDPQDGRVKVLEMNPRLGGSLMNRDNHSQP
jgi:predicted ATP-grasp superfamily ATP-dependent carboligase